MIPKPRLIAFEGIHGAGKTTVVNLLTEHLRARGVPVCLPRGTARDDGSPNSGQTPPGHPYNPPDRTLDPGEELNLDCARAAEIFSEMVEPALARGETVLLDGSLLTTVVRGVYGYGLDPEACASAAAGATCGREPDLTFILDVDPRTAGIRTRTERVRRHASPDACGSVTGSAFQQRMRAGLLSLAAERGLPLLHTERSTAHRLAHDIVGILEGAPPQLSNIETSPHWMVPQAWTFGQALASMPATMALYFGRDLALCRPLRREAAAEEPQLSAWTLDRVDPLREELLQAEPEYALSGLIRRPFEREDLRDQVAEAYPAAVARALRFVSDQAADTLREHLAHLAPGAVVESLSGREDPWASALREQLWEQADPPERASSLMYCCGAAAVRAREALFGSWPAHGISSLRGAPAELADPWLAQCVSWAPAAVLRALRGRDDPTAHDLRAQLVETGREVIDSIRGLGDPTSWALREHTVDRWPSAVAFSLIGVPQSPRRQQMLERCQTAGQGDVHMLRQLQSLQEYGRLPPWARADDSLDGSD
ncbi:MAG: hypothetical protein V3W41_02860 [Planctomycetota bacterium]